MSEFGAGVGLNEDWDLFLDQTGDLSMFVGERELQKDVAFNVAGNLLNLLGSPVRPSTQKEIQIEVRNTLVEEVRIDAVNDVEVRELSPDSYEVIAKVDASGEDVELVFEVEL